MSPLVADKSSCAAFSGLEFGHFPALQALTIHPVALTLLGLLIHPPGPMSVVHGAQGQW